MNSKAANELFQQTENSGSDEIVPLTEDKRVASLAAIDSTVDALKFVRDYVKEKRLKKQVWHNGLAAAESQLQRLGKLLGRDEDAAQAKAIEKSQVRILNDEVNRLRAELGAAFSFDGMAAKLEEMKNAVYEWWKSLGFLTSEGGFYHAYRGFHFKGKFSCYIDEHASSFAEDAPVTAKAKKKTVIDKLRAETDIGGRDDKRFLDTNRNRAWLIAQFDARFPDNLLCDFNINSFTEDGVRSQYYRSVEVMLPIATILQTPKGTP